MKFLRKINLLALVLCFVVIVFGSFVRLSDAGLGCPDWPGCYGHFSPHHAAEQIQDAHQAAPHGPVSMAKAWKEMLHRYLASFLGLLIIILAVLHWRYRRMKGTRPALAMALIGVVIFQGLLGKWTVTLLLKPAIVSLHLLGGMVVLALLTYMYYQLPGRIYRWHLPAQAKTFAALGLSVLFGQIALGGWTSTNYAALGCTDFPLCHGQLVPKMDIANAFHIFRELGMTADGALLSLDALTAIHWMHRLGAVLLGGTMLLVSFYFAGNPQSRSYAILMLLAIIGQIMLGIANVLYSLPLPLAVLHNAGAAVLVILFSALNSRLRVQFN